jgi:hypothetical protein
MSEAGTDANGRLTDVMIASLRRTRCGTSGAITQCFERLVVARCMSGMGVRRDKAALSS